MHFIFQTFSISPRFSLAWLTWWICPIALAAPCELTSNSVVELKSPYAVEGNNVFVALENLSGCLVGFSTETGRLEFQKKMATPNDDILFVQRDRYQLLALNRTQRMIHLITINSFSDIQIHLLLDYSVNTSNSTECEKSLGCQIGRKFSMNKRDVRKIGFIGNYLILMDSYSFVITKLKGNSIVGAQDLTHHWGIFFNLGDLVTFDQHESLLLVDIYDDVPIFEYLHFDDKEEFGGRPFFFRESLLPPFGFVSGQEFMAPDYQRLTESDLSPQNSLKNRRYGPTKYSVHARKRLLANESGEIINLSPLEKVFQTRFPTGWQNLAVRDIAWGMNNLLYVFENGQYVIFDKYMKRRPWNGEQIGSDERIFHGGDDAFFKLSSHGRLGDILTLLDSE